MIRRVLIANRGEIALRVIRTCRRLGIETVLAASDADLDSVPARIAGRVIRIGPAQSAQSYLNVAAVVAAAVAVKADAVHPGYGFLSENAAFARACARRRHRLHRAHANEQLSSAGDKWRAREIAEGAGLPVVPGGFAATAEDARALAARIGTPVLVKAVGGGGGRGMKLIRDARDTDATVGACHGRGRRRLRRRARLSRTLRRARPACRSADSGRRRARRSIWASATVRSSGAIRS